MKKLALLTVILILLLLPTVITFNLAKQDKKVNKQTKNLWAKKQPLIKSTKGLFAKVPPEAWGELTDLATASKYLGFNLPLPKSPKATAAGEPKIYVKKGTVQWVKEYGTAPKPDLPHKGGAQVNVYYPNGLKLEVWIEHPQAITLNFARHVAEQNKEISYWTQKGFLDGQLYELTTVNGFKGYQVEKGFNYMDALSEETTPNLKMREPRPAVLAWYDHKNWALFHAYAPLGVSLNELREVVESMYQ